MNRRIENRNLSFFKNFDADRVKEVIKEIENHTGQPNFDFSQREDVKVQIRMSEDVGPAKFKKDPLIPGGYIANALTIRAMRSDIFVLGDSLDDFSAPWMCACGNELDVQFWKLCPYCAREINP